MITVEPFSAAPASTFITKRIVSQHTDKTPILSYIVLTIFPLQLILEISADN